MLYNFQAFEVYNVRDLYKEANKDAPATRLLSDFSTNRLSDDYWSEYRENYAALDRVFMQRYASLIPLFQEDADDLSELLTNWRADIAGWLKMNDKRYSELWRVNSIPDNEAYSLVNNVDYTETIQHDLVFDKGQQQNILDGETNYGQQVVDDDKEFNFNTTNSEGSTTTNSTSAYNDSGYAPTDKSEQTINGYTDTQDNSMTYGAHKDERDDTMTEGARHDVTDEDTSIHKVGNMGVQTVDDMLKKHWENWEAMSFYDLVFREIAENFLRGC